MARNKEIKKILVRVPNWIGDAVICLPAIEALKKLYPASELAVLSKGRTIPVFQNNPGINEIIEYDDKGRHKGFLGRLRLSAEIKKRRFQLAVLFQNAFDAAFIAFVAGIPKRTGYARDLRAGLLTDPVPVTSEIKGKHQVFYYLNIIDKLGDFTQPPSPAALQVPKIYISQDENVWAEGFLDRNGLKGRAMAGAAPGASYGPAKRWMPERFAEVLTLLSSGYNMVPVIFGGPEDTEVSKDVSRRIACRHLNLAGAVTLRQTMALLKRLDVFITNDSGPMHISAALGVPTVAVFGSTDPKLTGPLGEATRIITKNHECSPCFKRVCRYGHYNCLKTISSKEVFSGVEALLGRKGAPGARGR